MTQKQQQSNILTIIICFFLFGMISFVTGMQDPFGVIVRAQFKASNAICKAPSGSRAGSWHDNRHSKKVKIKI